MRNKGTVVFVESYIEQLNGEYKIYGVTFLTTESAVVLSTELSVEGNCT